MNKNVIYNNPNYQEIGKMSYCINAYLKSSIGNQYYSELQKFISETYTNNSLNAQSEIKKGGRSGIIRETIFDNKSNFSVYWNLRKISNLEKEQHDHYLTSIGIKNTDKHAYYTKGCSGEKELFIGGSKEMLNFYCQLIPNNSICVKLLTKSRQKSLSNIFDNAFGETEKSDYIINEILSKLNEK